MSDDRTLLDRYATGKNRGTDHVALQDLALRIRYGKPRITETRTCETCASSAPTNPKPRCYVCPGATTAQSQWAPIKNSAII